MAYWRSLDKFMEFNINKYKIALYKVKAKHLEVGSQSSQKTQGMVENRTFPVEN